ncbi:MAG TPA: hypothetical protein VFR87_18915 [Nocardioidaceae bacterium]|nr:hypothetical protein [Nocardioidaceae bacterium]
MGPARITPSQAQQHSAELFAAVGGSRSGSGRRRRHGRRVRARRLARV